MQPTPIPTIPLNETTAIPVLGFDTQGLERQRGFDMTIHALEVGFRHLELSDHDSDMEAIHKAMGETGVPRKELFLSSKVWWNNLTSKQLRHSCEGTLTKLGVDYLDLYMVHWPNRTVPIGDTLGEMQALVSEGKIKAVGVCNFTQRHLEEARITGVGIAVHQFELHPTFTQQEMQIYCHSHGIAPMALSLFGEGKDLITPLIVDIASGYNATPAQIVLAWARAKNVIVAQCASMFPGVDEYIASLSLMLTEDEIRQIDSLPQRGRLIQPPFADFDY